MIALFLIGFSTIIVMMVLVIVIGIARAPDGYEDSSGFHYGKCPEPSSRPEQKQIKINATDKTLLDKPNVAANSKIKDAIVFVKKQIHVPAKLPRRSPVRKSAGSSAKTKSSGEDELPRSFGDSSGGTAVSDSNSPFPFPDPAEDGESFDAKP